MKYSHYGSMTGLLDSHFVSREGWHKTEVVSSDVSLCFCLRYLVFFFVQCKDKSSPATLEQNQISRTAQQPHSACVTHHYRRQVQFYLHVITGTYNVYGSLSKGCISYSRPHYLDIFTRKIISFRLIVSYSVYHNGPIRTKIKFRELFLCRPTIPNCIQSH